MDTNSVPQLELETVWGFNGKLYITNIQMINMRELVFQRDRNSYWVWIEPVKGLNLRALLRLFTHRHWARLALDRCYTRANRVNSGCSSLSLARPCTLRSEGSSGPGAPDLSPGIRRHFEKNQRWQTGVPAWTHEQCLMHLRVQKWIVYCLGTSQFYGLQGSCSCDSLCFTCLSDMIPSNSARQQLLFSQYD